ncbi:MAG: SpoIVB peptidase S55 domain-containing protein [Lachnospiraceae bacterium]
MKGQKGKFLGRMLLICTILYGVFWTAKSINQIEQEDHVGKPASGTVASLKNITRAIPGGTVCGIYTKTDGVLVLETAKLPDEDGSYQSPAEGKLEKGDYILTCNGVKLESKEDLIQSVEESGGKELVLKVKRKGKIHQVKMKPILRDGSYKIGVWVRDDMAGLGTITFYTKDGLYGALGHCVSDIDLGLEFDIKYGSIHTCKLTDIRQGKANQPGALIGYINYNADKPMGSVEQNSQRGIFGCLYQVPDELQTQEYLPIATRKEVHDGEAYLISDVSGKRTSYKINLTQTNSIFSSGTKNFSVEVTDSDLIELTGGIVQGMSGSPIIQDGKLVGALTHVLTKNPRKGYGILLEEMLQQ